VKVSVIIPTLNEADEIARAVRAIGEDAEVIVADGGSTDSTVEVAARLGAEVIRSRPGRGLQMDSGALNATGDVLLFLHADTLLPPGWPRSIQMALEDKDIVAGGFSLSIDSGLRRFRLVEFLANLRSRRLNLIYGDQGIFVRKEAFFEAGGFGKLPLMEDVDCVKRLSKIGRVVTLSERVLTSPRRWDKGGVVKNTIKNWGLLALYHAGVSPDRLYRWYYGQPATSQQG
jgi:rSAM/selenodomain-associated transferase 2